MASQIEKTPNNLWKEKEAIVQTPSMRSVKRIKSPTKKSQECKKSANELKIEDVFLNSEYFKHQSGNISSLSFCSGDNGENQWTIDSKFEIPVQQKGLKKTPRVSSVKVPASVSAAGPMITTGGKITGCNKYPSETIKSDTAVLEKTRASKGCPSKLKPQNCVSSENTEEKTNKFLEGILSGKGRLEQDLITLVTEQMFLAERELQVTRTHLMETISKLNERDLEILQLHEKIQNLQAAKKSDKKQMEISTKTSEDYQRLVLASEKLKKQVKDMEDFLNDYGLVWVGDKVANRKPDFDKIMKGFQRLNAVASEPKIIQTTMGAKFEVPHELPVIFYSNGLLLRNTDFRDYEDPSVTSFLKDVEDGYFPSELQSEFPEGVPFEVTDKRSEFYSTSSKIPVFQGQGNRLGSVNEGKPPSVVYLEPLKKLKNHDSRSLFSQDSYNGNTCPKKNKKRPRSGFILFQDPVDNSSFKSVKEFSEWEAPALKESQLTAKIRFGGDKMESFFLTFPEHEKMTSFQAALQMKLCERFHDECLITEKSTNTKNADFEFHIYGRNPIRLSEYLDRYPAECGIVNNCVINVIEI